MQRAQDREEDEEDDDEYFVPLQDQRVYGAGVKRRRVKFVSAGALESETSSSQANGTSDGSAADRYLSIVLGRQKASTEVTGDPHSKDTIHVDDTGLPRPDLRCSICGQDIGEIRTLTTDEMSGSKAAKTTPHERSIAHQLCLAHVHPPSDVDRRRQGFRYLSSYGWDPDSRQGLGANGEGALAPVRPRVKNDTVGLGARTEQRSRKDASTSGTTVKGQGKKLKLHAGQMRELAKEERKRAEALREMIWGDERVEKYLGSSASGTG